MSAPRYALLCLLFGSCAQPPNNELTLTTRRVEAARSADAAMFAPESLHHAELALATARSLVEDRSYRSAIHAAAEAVSHADDAFTVSAIERSIAARRVERCLNELEGLMAIARSRGAASKAPDELAAFVARHQAVEAIAESGDLLAALEQGHELEPELLAFEQRFRE